METKTATQMAKDYGLKSSVAFNKLLVKCGILRHTDKGYFLADGLRHLGMVDVVEVSFFMPNGFKATKKKAVWNSIGQQYIGKTLLRHGILPISERKDLFNQ